MTPRSAPSSSRGLAPVVVAGATGTLGRAITIRLIGEGCSVIGVARNIKRDEASESAGAEDGMITYAGDLQDLEFVRRVCKEARSVIFCAGSSGVTASFSDPVQNFTNSLIPWYNILTGAPSGCHILLLSSQLVYGRGRDLPFSETDPVSPESPYAMHRWLMEQYGRVWAHRRDLSVTALRAGNVFGDVLDIDAPRAHGVTAQLLSDLARRGKAELYGGGHQALEMLHADDLARAVFVILERQMRVPRFSVFNLHGERMSLVEIARQLSAGLGSGEIVPVPWPEAIKGAVAGDVSLDDSAFRGEFGWAPVHDIRAELQRIAAAWRDYPDADQARIG